MPKIVSRITKARRVWARPELQRLRPGDAEFNIDSGLDAETQTS